MVNLIDANDKVSFQMRKHCEQRQKVDGLLSNGVWKKIEKGDMESNENVVEYIRPMLSITTQTKQ